MVNNAKDFFKFVEAFTDALIFLEAGGKTDTGITAKLRSRIESDCGGFIEAAHTAISGRMEEAGADFLLTRNWYGEGFEDGSWSEDGARLKALARSFDVLYVVINEDGILGLLP